MRPRMAERSLVDTLAGARLKGQEVVLVSSGAIAAGLAPLSLRTRPRDLATQQAAASVGQSLLMGYYTQLFGAHGLGVGQVLLTVDDVTRHGHYRNAFRTFGRLLELGVVPTDAASAAAALAGDPVGTLFHPTGKRRPTRLLWLRHASDAQGQLRL